MKDEDLLPFDLPVNLSSIIKVIGVGGGGSNAVKHMYSLGIEGVDFIITNTDNQALKSSDVPIKIQLGASLTEGLGAGNRPDRGRESAVESIEDVKKELENGTKMVFITAGMGGGTGTGAAPVIAQAAQELGILTVGIVTIPFRFEGKRRLKQAAEGIREMQEHVDSLLIVNNERIREIYGDLGAKKAFSKADDVLTVAAKGIAEIITKEGHINVDFADVSTVMSNSGIALMGSGEAAGEDRAREAVEMALNSPLLDNNDIQGAKNILLNISSGSEEATMDEIGFINEYVQDAAGNNADLIFGSSSDESLGDKVAVTIIATGFAVGDIAELYLPEENEEIKVVANPDLSGNSTQNTQEVIEPTLNVDETVTPNIEDEIKPEEKDIFVIDEEDDDNHIQDYKDEDIEFVVDNKREVEIADNENSNDDIVIKTVKKTEKELAYSYNGVNVSSKNYNNNIEEMEKTPAFMRRGVKISKFEENETNVSRVTVKGDGTTVKLSENNPHLHDKAD